jgi:hypothetical protein
MNVTLTLPCGHTSPLDEAFIDRDQYRCPACRGAWHWITGAPIKHPSGWIEPGTRTMRPGLPDLGLPGAESRRFGRRQKISASGKCPGGNAVGMPNPRKVSGISTAQIFPTIPA